MVLTLGLVFGAVLGACNLLGKDCPADFDSLCNYIEDLEPHMESADANALQGDVFMECCKRDYAFPDEASQPGFDPEAFCVRSGAFRGAGTCLTEEELADYLLAFAPLSVEHLIHTTEVFSRLNINMADMAVLVRTVDPDWYLVFIPYQDFSGWYFSAIIQINRNELNQFPEEVFVSWPLDAKPPNPIPRSIQGVG